MMNYNITYTFIFAKQGRETVFHTCWNMLEYSSCKDKLIKLNNKLQKRVMGRCPPISPNPNSPNPYMLGLGIGLGLELGIGLRMGLGIGLGSGFDYFRQYNVIRRIGIRRNGIRRNVAEPM